MFRDLKIPLHITLLALILTLLITVAGSLALYNYDKSSDAAVEIAEELLLQVNRSLLADIDALFAPVLHIGERVAELPNLAHKPELTSHPATWFFIQTLESAPQIYSIYMGYEDGDFYQIIQLSLDDEDRRLQLGAPESTRYALRRIITKNDETKAELWRFLDSSRRTVGSRMVRHSTYDPRKRPWYQNAQKDEKLIRTKPYVFASNRSLGLTVARRFDGQVPGVFGVDLTLKSVSSFLAEQQVGRHGAAFLFDFFGNLVAHPDPELCIQVQQMGTEVQVLPTRLNDLQDPIIPALYTSFSEHLTTNHAFAFKVDKTPYLGMVTRISDSVMEDGYVAVYAPQSDFTATMAQVLDDTKIFTGVVLAIVLPLAFLIARAMSRPLMEISTEAERIQKLDLGEKSDVSSFISEINLLANSFSHMKGALKTFGQYVPKSLVQRIVESGETPTLGGRRRPISLMFTDVADFTTISETMGPEELMLQASEYFQAMGSTIMEHNGTIDKFIGDAIMAFWNAPAADPDHARNACFAALEAAKVSNDLNEAWAAQGKNLFYTRFGLHTGECIVGNVGSSDRMDYTAMGDAVNLASRLEGLNKYFGTQILASESIREQAGDDFLFCPAGRVVPKGAIAPLTIYTLLGTKPDRNLPQPASRDAQAFCKEWKAAYALFQERRFEDAARAFETLETKHDCTHMAEKYAARARAYAATPPGDDWQGVETFTTK